MNAVRRTRIALLTGALAVGAACAPGAPTTTESAETGTGAGGAATSGGGGSGGKTSAGGAGGTSSSSSAGGSAGAGGATKTGCTTDADCKGSPVGSVCDAASGACVACLPANDTCGAGQFCDPVKHACKAGCKDDKDCADPLVCDVGAHQCVGCVDDAKCGAGTVCNAGNCVPGCNPKHDCMAGESCCADSQCHDLAKDVAHCGTCGTTCKAPANAEATCAGGACGLGACKANFADCDGDPANGCEHNTLADGPCLCVPGATQPCYDGAPGTQNVGPCKGGQQTCNADGMSWSLCQNEVLPQPEQCANGVDDDCDGKIDVVPDIDGDGWSVCDGDCCETPQQCADPALVNPGAFDVGGDAVDNDCNGVVDEPPASCDQGLASNSASALDFAKAIDLCQQTTEAPALKDKRWGVIGAGLLKADGSANPAARSHAIRNGFGSAIKPKKGAQIAVLSTGSAADEADQSPAYVSFQAPVTNSCLLAGTCPDDTGTKSPYPADWLAANGGNLPNAPGCPDPDPLNDSDPANPAKNPMMLKVRVRVPTNAKSFSVATYFLSAEYPEWVCSPYNDFFVALLDSQFSPAPGEQPNPKDKNLASYTSPQNKVYPVGVNLAFGDTGLFSVCKNGQTGCANGATLGSTSKCTSNAELAGTGFEIANPAATFASDVGYCGSNNQLGGGTGWLVTTGNVKPGETMELRFAVWDTNDPWYDSVVLLDAFQWSVTATQPGTHQ
jgi:hypothetical protein